MLDIFIIGAGPIGLACGLAAQKAGLSFVIVDKGCLVNSLYNYPSTMTFFSTSEKLEIGGIPFVSNNVKPTRAEALEYYRRVAFSNHLPIKLFEEVTQVSGEDGAYTIITAKASYRVKHIIIATGFYDIAVKLNIPGEDLPKVKHYYKDPHYFNSSLKAIRENEVDIATPEGIVTIANDFVLAMTGYKPNFDFLKKIGIHLSVDEKLLPQYHAETMETTNLPGVYLAGVVCGGMDTHLWFIENSRVHADMIIGDIVKKR
jgi:thioredoxin reductase (NADPH)